MLLPSDNKAKQIFAILEDGFKMYKKNATPVTLLSFLGVLCLFLTLAIKMYFHPVSSFVWLIAVIGIVLSQVFLGGVIYFLYTQNKNIPCTIKEALVISLEKLPALVITTFIYCLIVFIGTVAFIIPGVFLSIACIFGFILIYTDNYDPILALHSSFRFARYNLLLVGSILFLLALFVSLSNLLILMTGYLLFTIFSMSTSVLFISNLILLTIVNALLTPIAYSIMLQLLHHLKVNQNHH